MIFCGATTLPEIVVTISALRLGALDMAISNLLGSNLFNILILAVDDALYFKGPLLSHVSDLHAVSAISATMMSGVAIVGLFYRPKARLGYEKAGVVPDARLVVTGGGDDYEVGCKCAYG